MKTHNTSLIKTSIKTMAAGILIASFTAPAFAAVDHDIRALAGTNGYIDVEVKGNTVTLTGFVEDTYSRQLAEQTAKQQGYEVENFLILSN